MSRTDWASAVLPVTKLKVAKMIAAALQSYSISPEAVTYYLPLVFVDLFGAIIRGFLTLNAPHTDQADDDCWILLEHANHSHTIK